MVVYILCARPALRTKAICLQKIPCHLAPRRYCHVPECSSLTAQCATSKLWRRIYPGTIHSAAFQDLPALVEGGEQDSADMEPVEEEFDLADVLGEDVAGSGSKEDLLKQADKELEVVPAQWHS